MYQDYPNFGVAQTVAQKYLDYPILAWKKMFKEVFDTLNEYHEDVGG